MGAAARPVRTKRPSRRAIEAAGGQIPAAPSTKRPGRIANADRQAQAPAVVGMAEAAAARSAARSGRAKRRRTPSSPPKKRSLLRSHALTLDPCSNRGEETAVSKLQQEEELPGAKRPRSTDLPCLPDSRRRACANDLLDDAVDSDVASGITDLPICPPDNNNNRGEAENNLLDYDVCPPDNNKIWRDLAKNLLLRIDSSATKRPCPPDNNNWRDWANLADGPAGLIAERVLAYDVADYLRFRAVCPPWRQCSTEPRSGSGLDRRFHPWRWTMLREELAAPDSRCFLNTSTGQCVQVDIPELNDHLLLAVTPEGLLVLVLKTQRTTVRLLNPLTRRLTELPPLTTLLPPEHHDKLLERNHDFNGQFAAWGSGIANDDSTVVLCFNWLGMIGLAKPGDDSWKLVKYGSGRGRIAVAPLMFAGRFYCVNLSGVRVLEMGADHPPQLKVAAKLSMHVSQMADTVHLVNNCGELMLVHRRGRRLTARNKSDRRYDAYRVNLDTGTLSLVKSLGGSGAGHALFMGRYCSLSVSLDVFPYGSLCADTIYLSFDLRERMMLTARAYHLASGRVEIPCSLVPQPHTLIDCLSLSNTVTEC